MVDVLAAYISVGEAVAVVFILLLIIVVLLILLVVNNRRMHDLTYPVYDYIVKQAESKAQEITQEAMEKSRAMVRDAEKEGLKMVEQEKLESSKIEKEYAEKLAGLEQETEKMLGTYTEAIQNDMKRLSEGLEKRVAESISKNEQFLQGETQKLSTQLSGTFSTLEANAKEQIRNNVERELISVKKLVETYRQERFALIDHEIMSLIERTTSIALQKTLSLEDHTELIYRALEEAKTKNVFS